VRWSTTRLYYRGVATSNPTSERAATKEERRARSLANLEKNKIKKGEIRNPTGKNGRDRSDYVVSVLEEHDQQGVSHIRRILLKQIARAVHGSDVAGKTLIDHYKGRAKLEMDVTSGGKSLATNRKPTTAETRQELDRVLAAIEKKDGGGTVGIVVHAPTENAEGSEAQASEPKATP
jgi:hypothetical protein